MYERKNGWKKMDWVAVVMVVILFVVLAVRVIINSRMPFSFQLDAGYTFLVLLGAGIFVFVLYQNTKK